MGIAIMMAADDTMTVVTVVMLVRMMTKTALTRTMVTTLLITVLPMSEASMAVIMITTRGRLGVIISRGPFFGKRVEVMKSLEGDREQRARSSRSMQVTLSSLLHAGSKTAGITGFAVSTAFLNINSLRPRSSGGDHSCRPNPSPAADPGWASLGGKKAILL